MEAWTDKGAEIIKLIHGHSHTRSASGQGVHNDAVSMATWVGSA